MAVYARNGCWVYNYLLLYKISCIVDGMVEAYCVKCRQKREMKDGKEVTMPGKGGERRAMTGLCVVCGTKMFRILGKK